MTLLLNTAAASLNIRIDRKATERWKGEGKRNDSVMITSGSTR